MPRPFKKRMIRHSNNWFFKPAGIRMIDLEQVMLSADEYESLRLADFESLSHEKAGKKMGVSRQTFGRIVEVARKKVSDALVNGKSIVISTEGPVQILKASFNCRECGKKWKGNINEKKCPSCGYVREEGRNKHTGG